MYCKSAKRLYLDYCQAISAEKSSKVLKGYCRTRRATEQLLIIERAMYIEMLVSPD